MILVYLIENVFFCFLAFSVLYLLFFAIAGRLGVSVSIPSTSHFSRVLVLIPSYKEDAVIVTSAQTALGLNYPSKRFIIHVIADSLREETIEKLKSLDNLTVQTVEFEKSTKVKSLQSAVTQYNENEFDFVVILDADNLVQVDFLIKINDAYCAGYKSIQGKRVAKNHNSGIAILDGMSEAINNHIFRKGYNSIGASSSLIGSGMAFDFSIFKEIINSMSSVGGFDRELHALLLKLRIKTKYVPEAIVFDEKVDNTKSLGNQRKRWISSQFFYLRKYFFSGFKGLFRGDINYFDATVTSNLILPRVILLGTLFLIGVVVFVFQDFFWIPYIAWLILLLLLMLALMISTPKSYFSVKSIKAVALLPLSFATLLISLVTSWNSNKNFIHTPHGVQERDQEI